MKIVAVSGGYDPLHKGHILNIEEALKLGDELLVILTRDDQLDIKNHGSHGMDYVERSFILWWALRGCGKPYRIVANLDKDITITESLRFYKPDILAKGGDRTPDNMPLAEIEICKEIGCQLVYGVGGDKIQSSSWIKQRLGESR